MGRLYNVEEGVWHTVPDHQVHDMLMSKKWAPHAGLGLNVVMPNGDAGQIKGSHYEYWASKGARFETDRDRDKRRLGQAVRDTPYLGGSPLAAYAVGAGKGASISATDLTSRASERNPLSDEHPIASMLGELTGVIATLPATLSGGPSTTAAQLSRIGRIGRMLPGAILTRKATAIGSEAVKAGLGTSLAETMVGRAAATSITASLESIAYTAPGEFAGYLEERPGYTADAVVGKLATSALWGGALGFGLPLGVGGIIWGAQQGVRAGGFAMQSTYRMLTGNPISKAAGRMFLNNAVRWRDLDPNQAAGALSMTLPDLKARSRTMVDAMDIVTDQRYIQKTQEAELALSKQELLVAKQEAKLQELAAQKTAAKYEGMAEKADDLAERELRRIQRTEVDPAKKQLEGVRSAEEERIWQQKVADVKGRVAAQQRSITQSADDIAATRKYDLAEEELEQARAALDARGLIDDAAPIREAAEAPIAKAQGLTAKAAAKAEGLADDLAKAKTKLEGLGAKAGKADTEADWSNISARIDSEVSRRVEGSGWTDTAKWEKLDEAVLAEMKKPLAKRRPISDFVGKKRIDGPKGSYEEVVPKNWERARTLKPGADTEAAWSKIAARIDDISYYSTHKGSGWTGTAKWQKLHDAILAEMKKPLAERRPISDFVRKERIYGPKGSVNTTPYKYEEAVPKDWERARTLKPDADPAIAAAEKEVARLEAALEKAKGRPAPADEIVAEAEGSAPVGRERDELLERVFRAEAAVAEAEPAARAAAHGSKLADMGHEARRLELALDDKIAAARKEYDKVVGHTAEIKEQLADDLWELEEKIAKELKPLRGLEGKPGPGGRNSVEFDTNPKNIVNAPDKVKASVATRAADAAEESEALVEEFWDFWGSPEKSKLVVAALSDSPPAVPAHEIAEHTMGLLQKTAAALGESTVETAGIADHLLAPFRTKALAHVEIALQAVAKVHPAHTGGKTPSVEQVAEVHMAINKLKRYLNNDLFKGVDRGDPILEAAGFFKGHAKNLNTFLTNDHYWGRTLSGIQRQVNKASERVINNTRFFKSTFLKETGRRKVLVEGVEKTHSELIGKAGAFSNYVGSYLTPANAAPQRVLVERITALDDLAAAIMSAEKITGTVGKGKDLARVSRNLRRFHEVEAKAFHDANEMLRLTTGDFSHGMPSQLTIPGLDKSVFMQGKARLTGLDEAKAALLHTQKEQARIGAQLTKGPKAKLDKLENLKSSTALENKGRKLTEAISEKERLLAEEAVTLQHSAALKEAKENLAHWEDSYTTAQESLAAFRKEVIRQGKGATGERLAAKNAAAEKEIEIMEKIAQAEEKIKHSEMIISFAEKSKRIIGKTDKELKAFNTGLGPLVEMGALGALAYGGSPLLGIAAYGAIHAFRRPAHFAQMTARVYQGVSETYTSINTRLDEIVGRIAKGSQRAVREGKPDYLATFASHVGVGIPHSMELPMPLEVKAKKTGDGFEIGRGERRERVYE